MAAPTRRADPNRTRARRTTLLLALALAFLTASTVDRASAFAVGAGPAPSDVVALAPASPGGDTHPCHQPDCCAIGVYCLPEGAAVEPTAALPQRWRPTAPAGVGLLRANPTERPPDTAV